MIKYTDFNRYPYFLTQQEKGLFMAAIPLVVEEVDSAADWDPYHRRNDHYGAHYVVLEEHQHFVDVDVLYHMPEPLNNVLDSFDTCALNKVSRNHNFY